MNIIYIGNTLQAIARDPAWGAVGTLTAQGAAMDSRLCRLPHPLRWQPDLRRKCGSVRTAIQRHWPGSRVAARLSLMQWSTANMTALHFFLLLHQSTSDLVEANLRLCQGHQVPEGASACCFP